MKRIHYPYAIAIVGIAAAVAISQAVETRQQLAVVAELPAAVGVLDMSRLSAIPEVGEELSGGGTTVKDTSFHAFGRGPMNMQKFELTWTDFREGRKLFERNWYATKNGHMLLGPLYNAGSCSHCHTLDGRGRPPLDEHAAPESMVLRLSVPRGNSSVPEPVYGEQLSYYSADTSAPEGTFSIEYDEVRGEFADGEHYTLRVPTYEFRNLGRGPISENVQISPRVAPPTFGLGLLEAISDSAILAHADPADRNRDGISGRPNYVTDIRTGAEVLGRFGWKASQPSITQQILKAFSADIGITSRLYPSDGATSTSATSATGMQPELADSQLAVLLFYMKMLAVPERRHWTEPAVLHGKAVFENIGCAHCHTSRFTTGAVEGYPELSNQTIRPYSDLLLHDMGEGLADNRSDGRANGREWRTPPLWGIGLTKTVNNHTFFLHDGRARNLEEAILWHGGEAAAAQINYRRLRQADRKSLLACLGSL